MSRITDWYNRFRHYFSNNYPRIYSFCEAYKSVIKFIVSGGSAGVTDLVLLFVFHDPLRMGLVISTSLAFILSFLVSFSLQKFWTFRNYGENKMLGQLMIYLANAFVGLSFNGALMHLLVNRYSVWYILAQIIVNLIIGFWNFIIYKFIIFKKTKHEAFS